MPYKDKENKRNYAKRYYHKHKDKILLKRKENPYPPEKKRDQHLRRQYGITQERYDEMLNEQGGLCAICHRPPATHSSYKILHVDHNHVTGEVRGLLCATCNGNFGWFEQFKENVEDYFERTS